MLNISKRAKDTPPSPIRKLVPFAEAAKLKGVKIYHLNIGQPDIESPEKFLKALKYFKPKVVAYENSLGNPKLRQALTEYYKQHKIKLSQDNIIITTGGSEAIVFSLLSVCDPGEECLLFEPTYANYLGFSHMAGINLKALPTEAENGFHLPEEAKIEKSISEKTRAIIICNPNNPTGTVYSKLELLMINRLALKHNLFIISDETYREFVYGASRHYSYLSLTQSPQHIILVDSFSKRFSLCGARLGILASFNREVLDSVSKFAQARLAAPTVEQFAALKALETPKSYFQNINREYQSRRDVIIKGLKEIPGVLVKKPDGAFYCIAELPVKDADHFSKWLLTDFRYNNQTVMLAPATGFYCSNQQGKNQVRIAYVLNKKYLRNSLIIIKKALEKYKNTIHS